MTTNLIMYTPTNWNFRKVWKMIDLRYDLLMYGYGVECGTKLIPICFISSLDTAHVFA